MNLIVTFDLHLKNLKIPGNYCTPRGRTFMYCICVYYDKSLQPVQKFLPSDIDRYPKGEGHSDISPQRGPS